MWRFFSVGLFTCALFWQPVATSFAAGELTKLKIVYASFTGAYTPLWIAVEEGLGKKYGFELEAVYSGRVRPHQLLMSGDSQYVVSGGTAVVTSYAVGVKDLAIIASFANHTGTSIFTKAKITNQTALRGKVFGAGRPGAISDLLLRYMLKRNFSLDPIKDVKILPLGEASDILPALERGVIDAGILATPARLLARQMGFHELLNSDDLNIQFPYTGVSTLKATVKRNPEATIRLMRSMTDAVHVFRTNKDKSMAVMKKYLRGASDEVLQETYSYFSVRVPRFPYPSLQAIKTALEILSDQYPQARTVEPSEIADLSFMKAVEKEMTR
jgi:ABC-type nitrate/sulfonate/bicarbonate transport system substrate-binding protein